MATANTTMSNNLILWWPKLFEGRVIDEMSDADSDSGCGYFNYSPGGGTGAGWYGDRDGDGLRINTETPSYYNGKKV